MRRLVRLGRSSHGSTRSHPRAKVRFGRKPFLSAVRSIERWGGGWTRTLHRCRPACTVTSRPASLFSEATWGNRLQTALQVLQVLRAKGSYLPLTARLHYPVHATFTDLHSRRARSAESGERAAGR